MQTSIRFYIYLLRIQIVRIYLYLYYYKIQRKEIIFFLTLCIGNKGIKSENNCLKNEK